MNLRPSSFFFLFFSFFLLFLVCFSQSFVLLSSRSCAFWSPFLFFSRSPSFGSFFLATVPFAPGSCLRDSEAYLWFDREPLGVSALLAGQPTGARAFLSTLPFLSFSHSVSPTAFFWCVWCTFSWLVTALGLDLALLLVLQQRLYPKGRRE